MPTCRSPSSVGAVRVGSLYAYSRKTALWWQYRCTAGTSCLRHICFNCHYSYPNGFIIYDCTDDTPTHMQQPFLRKVLPYLCPWWETFPFEWKDYER